MKQEYQTTIKKIGRQIQAAREQRGLSQAQAAAEAGIARVTLAEIERGTANPGIETLTRVCGALRMELSELFASDFRDDPAQIILQPINGSLFQALKQAMESGEYTSCQMLAAYAKSSGVDLMAQSILSMRKAGGRVEAYIGIDQKNTTAEALYKLLHICDGLYVVHDQAVAQTYHPKLYLLTGPEHMWAAVGSNNLTRGGLCTNYEACTVQRLDLAAPWNRRLHEGIREALRQYCDASLVQHILSVGDIQRLLSAGLVSTEQESRMSIRKSAIFNPSAFGHRPVPDIPVPSFRVPVPVGLFAALMQDSGPRQPPSGQDTGDHGYGDCLITAQAALTAERGPDIHGTAWFFSGKLTGGSRNILDLSESAVLRGGTHQGKRANGTVPGGVSLFGLDPKDHSAWKNLTILYNGIPYRFSTIKFAPGKSNWRFQLKGKAETGKTALSQFGEDFINHILLFHKVSDDCYILEVMEESELPALKAHSSFWATNGRMLGGRPFGVLAV